MPTVVVPFRGSEGKSRIARLPLEARAALREAMLADVLAACEAVGATYAVSSAQRPVGRATRRISWMTSTRSKTSNAYAAGSARRRAGRSRACTWAPPHEAPPHEPTLRQIPRMKVTVLSGGVGGARFLRGMSLVADLDNI